MLFVPIASSGACEFGAGQNWEIQVTEGLEPPSQVGKHEYLMYATGEGVPVGRVEYAGVVVGSTEARVWDVIISPLDGGNKDHKGTHYNQAH